MHGKQLNLDSLTLWLRSKSRRNKMHQFCSRLDQQVPFIVIFINSHNITHFDL